MGRILVVLLCSLALASCRAGQTVPTPTASIEPGTVPSTEPTIAAAPLFFDNIDMTDAQSGWGWKGISQLYRTDDGGETWHEVHLQGKILVTGASFLSGKEAWLPGVPDAQVSRSVYRTQDGGMTWTKLGALHAPNLELYFHDAQVGWALNGTGAAGNVFYELYQTTDGGITWLPLQVAGPGGADQGPMAGTLRTMTGDSLAFMPPDTIWVASGYGLQTSYAGLAVSRDAGKTWQDVNPPLPADLVKAQPPVVVSAPQFVTQQDAFLPVRVGDRQVFFASHDAGNSWMLLPPVLPAGQMMSRTQFVNTRDGFTVCDAELCSTQDGGETWQQIATPFPVGSPSTGAFVSQFDFVDGLIGWAILTDQQGSAALLKTADGGRTWIRLQPRLGF